MERLKVQPTRHYGRWIFSLLAFGLLILALTDVFNNPRFYWDTVFSYLFTARILSGFGVTLLLTVISMTAGIILGIALALMQVSRIRLLAAIANFYIWFFRGTPLLVQVIFWYNIAALYPEIHIGLPYVATFFVIDANVWITPLTAGLLALSLNEGAYMAEIVRAGLIAVDPGQMEAADSIGMSKFRAIRRIILPQAMRIIIPPTGNQTIGMLKTTSLVSVVAVPELLYTAQNIAATNYKTIPLLIAASIWYITATTILSVFQHFIEKKYSKGSGRSEPKTLKQVIRENLSTLPFTGSRTRPVRQEPEETAAVEVQNAR